MPTPLPPGDDRPRPDEGPVCFAGTCGAEPPQNPLEDIVRVINGARKRVRESLNDKCAEAIGAADAAAAVLRLNTITIGVGALGAARVVVENGRERLGGGGFAAFRNGQIIFNTDFNWADPTKAAYYEVNGKMVEWNALESMAAELGMPSGSAISADQLADLVLLHELSHSFQGANHPPTEASDLNQKIWNNCLTN
jgi:hypothetical protein